MNQLINTTESEWRDWLWQLRHAKRSLEDLKELELYSNTEYLQLKLVMKKFKTLVTPYYLSLIDRNDPFCPIRLQALPDPQELSFYDGEQEDPIGDKAHAPTPILVHRYPDRALLFPTFECPMFCRYCFRKESLNTEPIKLHQDLPKSLTYLTQNPEIKEIILSGGDPLMLSSNKLGQLIHKLVDIGIKRLRIHSRTPVTLPQRINVDLLTCIAQYLPKITITLITHFNHPKELSHLAKEGLTKLKDLGIVVLNQSVLLKGVNNNIEILKNLFYELGDQGVLPYYLHHPDLTRGTHHFRCSIDEGLLLYRMLRGQISGYLLPRYVIDIPGGGGKVEVDSSAVIKGKQPGEWLLTSPLTKQTQHYFDLAAQKHNNANSSSLV